MDGYDMTIITRRFMGIALALFLGACTGLEALVVPVTMIEGTSLATTHKSMSDHVVSFFSGKDCATPRTERGDTYCKEDEPNPSPMVHCYRTLGDVNCYGRSDPYAGQYSTIGSPDTTLQTR